MRYELPQIIRKRVWEIQPVFIFPEAEESLEEIAFQITCECLSKQLITEKEKTFLRKMIAENDKLRIDYWKKQPIYLLLKIRDKQITLSFYHWVKRWNGWDQNNGVLPSALNALEETLKKVNAILARNCEASYHEVKEQIQKLTVECSVKGLVVKPYNKQPYTPFSFFESVIVSLIGKRRLFFKIKQGKEKFWASELFIDFGR